MIAWVAAALAEDLRPIETGEASLARADRKDAAALTAALAERGVVRPTNGPGTVLLLEGACVHARSEAVLRTCTRLGAPWAWLAVLRVVPRAWRDALYAFVARHRARIAGRLEACRVPSATERARFLDADERG
mgnify:CR=1 FL=1